MKRIALALVVALLLTGCGDNSNTESAPQQLSVPTDCTDTKVLAAFPEKIPNPKFIDTAWEPSEGTDLFAVYNSGGIACSYGIQEAEIGATILWAPDNKILFDERATEWIAAGQKEVDLPDFAEEKAYVLTEGTEGQGEFHVWAINYLIDGVWIQIGATFLGSIEEAMPLVKAAAESLRTAKQAKATNLAGCYYSQSESEIQVFKVEYHDNNTVSGSFYNNNFKDIPTKGLFLGVYTNGVLKGTNSIETLEGSIDEELTFKGDKKELVKENDGAKFTPAEDCETLLNQ